MISQRYRKKFQISNKKIQKVQLFGFEQDCWRDPR